MERELLFFPSKPSGVSERGAEIVGL